MFFTLYVLLKSPLPLTLNSVVLVYTVLHIVKQSCLHGDCTLYSRRQRKYKCRYNPFKNHCSFILLYGMNAKRHTLQQNPSLGNQNHTCTQDRPILSWNTSTKPKLLPKSYQSTLNTLSQHSDISQFIIISNNPQLCTYTTWSLAVFF